MFLLIHNYYMHLSLSLLQRCAPHTTKAFALTFLDTATVTHQYSWTGRTLDLVHCTIWSTRWVDHITNSSATSHHGLQDVIWHWNNWFVTQLCHSAVRFEREREREREADRQREGGYTISFLPGDATQEPEAKPICSDHCNLLQVVEFCSTKVYELLLKDSQLSMPDCSAELPETGPNCMPVTQSYSIEDHHRHGKSSNYCFESCMQPMVQAGST